MVFSSPRFLLFLAVLLALLAAVGARDVKKRLLTAASCAFYAAWDWRYLGLLLGISVVDYFAAARIHASGDLRRRRAWLFFSVASNLGVLAWFKYCNFFIENANAAFGGVGLRLEPMEILLPAGISFYTFKTMSYTIDVYRGHLEPCRSWLDYAMFITFFPELIAGPIVRASVFLPQMGRDPGPSRQRLVLGGSIFLQGLTKKVFLADRLSSIADPVFADPARWSTATAWIGLLAYSLQIYCDFSGYSDMAIGTAKMIGYDLPENFRMPYLSTSITEFWRRWHITLSSWLRDYLYIPLGGNRGGKGALYRNLILTMLLGGLWHGASWNFVIWGGLHGLALAAHKIWSELRGGSGSVPSPVAWLLTQVFVLLTWVPFRAGSLETSRTLFLRLAGAGEPGGAAWIPIWAPVCLVVVVLGHVLGGLAEQAVARGAPGRFLTRIFEWVGGRLTSDRLSGPYVELSSLRPIGVYALCLWLFALASLSPTRTSPFIYFQF